MIEEPIPIVYLRMLCDRNYLPPYARLSVSNSPGRIVIFHGDNPMEEARLYAGLRYADFRVEEG